MMKRVLCIKDVKFSVTLLHEKSKVYELKGGNTEGYFNLTTEDGEIHVVKGPGDTWFDEHFKLIEEDGVEYRVVKAVSARSLSETDIGGLEFKRLYNFLGSNTLNVGCKIDSLPFEKELLRLGYLEEVVVDPVVKEGDCFEIDGDGIGMVCWLGYANLAIIGIHGNYVGNVLSEPGTRECGKDMHLSTLIKPCYELNQFKPCKINVTVEGE